MPDAVPLGPQVLLVEDDPDVAPVVYRAVREVAPRASIVWRAESERARAALLERDFDVVIADYAIDGGGTGWTLLQQARARNASVRCGMLSALPLGVEKLGVPFLMKPFSWGELVAFLRPLLTGSAVAQATAGGGPRPG